MMTLGSNVRQMGIDPLDWYHDNPDLSSPFQGDIYKDVPVLLMPDKISKWLILRSERPADPAEAVIKGKIPVSFKPTPEGITQNRWLYRDPDGEIAELVAAKARLMKVIIVTQTCDLQNRSTYQVAPVYPASKMKKREHLEANNLYYAFYLPRKEPIAEDLYADLSHITTVPSVYFSTEERKKKFLIRLSQPTTRIFQGHLGRYFGRPFGYDALHDKVPFTGEYACVRCFYKALIITRKSFQQGERFTPCDTCKKGMWIDVSAGQQTDLNFNS